MRRALLWLEERAWPLAFALAAMAWLVALALWSADLF